MAKKPLKLVTIDEKYDVLVSTESEWKENKRDYKTKFIYFDDRGMHFSPTAKIVEGNKRVKETENNYWNEHKKRLVGKLFLKRVSNSLFTGGFGSNRYKDEEKELTVKDWEQNFYKARGYNSLYYRIHNEERKYLGDHWPSIEDYKDGSTCYTVEFPIPMICSLFGEGEVSENDFLDENKWSYKVDDYVEISRKSGTENVLLVGMNKSGFKIMKDDGATESGIKPERILKKVQKVKKIPTMDGIPEGIRQNYQDSLDNPNLKVFPLSKGIVQQERRGYDAEGNWVTMLKDNEVELIECPNCGIKTQLYLGSCVGCKQSWREVTRADDESKALLNVGPEPKPNDICIAEVKSCDNCRHGGFGYGRNGKRINGYCSFTRLCIRSYNTCDNWMPEDDASFSKNMSGALTNLGYGVGQYKDKDLHQFNYDKNMHEENKKKAQKLKQDFKIGYQDYVQLLKDKFGL